LRRTRLRSSRRSPTLGEVRSPARCNPASTRRSDAGSTGPLPGLLSRLPLAPGAQWPAFLDRRWAIRRGTTAKRNHNLSRTTSAEH
jgi:hypothetical protein